MRRYEAPSCSQAVRKTRTRSPSSTSEGPWPPVGPIGAHADRSELVLGHLKRLRHDPSSSCTALSSTPSSRCEVSAASGSSAAGGAPALPASTGGPPCGLKRSWQCSPTGIWSAQLRAPPSKASSCVKGHGLCPAAGWTVDQYCPSCHG